MNIQLFRIDDRLIHGQVVIGWANALNTESLILCDNSVFENDWEKELYLSCAPAFLSVTILNEDLTLELLTDENSNLSKTIILVNGPFVIENLVNNGLDLASVNVGGIHFREGRKNFLPYLYLDDEEIASFKRSMDKGIIFECLDVPSGTKINLQTLLT